MANCYLNGFSLGSSYALWYLSLRNQDKYIKGMISVSNPFDVYKAASNLNKPCNLIYSKHLVTYLKEILIFNKRMVDKVTRKWKVKIDYDNIDFSSTTFEFDKYATFKIYKGIFHSSKHYYHTFSCHKHFHKVEVPVLFIHSKNDFLCKEYTIPKDVIL